MRLTRFPIFCIFCLLVASCGGSKSAPIGSWNIRSKPGWVTSAWLDHRSNTWQFLPDGTCIFGTATGSYQMLPENRMKVQFAMQQATPGYAAVFTVTVSGNSLTLKNLAETEPVVLEE